MRHRAQLTHYFVAGIAAASARLTLPDVLPKHAPAGRTFVFAYGKAAADMAKVAADHMRGELVGLAVTRHGHGVDLSGTGIDLIEARHPVPDLDSLTAGERMLNLAATIGSDDRVIFLASGGGSALLCAPAPGITLSEKQALTDALVRSGAPIGEINLVRRHVSRIKGGRLAALAGAGGAALYTFVISDVVGNDPALVASGPSISAPFEPDRALAILSHAGVDVPDHVAMAIHANRPQLANPHPVRVIASSDDALAEITRLATEDGWQVVDAGSSLSGDAANAGKRHALEAQLLARKPGRHLMLSGGELTVTRAAKDGQGGPNLEYLVALMSALPPNARIEALAGDSDGIDGTEDNAGGYLAAGQIEASDGHAALARNRTYGLVNAVGGLIKTGPTRTNVNDIRMIAIEGSQS
ncbi:putative hydroxypyruvate reductase [Candidatus Phycosocius bacilliformis]|uniref:Putative hydroxypyruvate reductase n=1 Tax=Candidatus Phycosocius bacilliformis TaxID=1445552 RepID=A0A2P2EE59_9PROT|nr:DUF4147 domain-containing protein [Candidatus Phycosocius bacilliformis]GBF59335.1 putative hydroxypyruvate reductase [Candidatus Phycosocius bacilliformis]